MTLLIAGPGRAGTTALTQLYGALGYRLGDVSEIDRRGRAGLESELSNVDADVIKNPRLSFDLRNPDARHIDAVLVALRDVEEVVASRVRAAFAGDRLRADGAFAGARTIRGLRTVALNAAYRVALDCAELEIPIVFIAYPRLTRDVDYCFRVLSQLPLAIDRGRFEAAWRATMRPAEEDPGPLTMEERVRVLALEVRDLWVDVWKRRLPFRP